MLSLIIGVVNCLIKPIVALLSFPVSALTLGLFGVVVNGVLLLLIAWVADMVWTSRSRSPGSRTRLSLHTFVAIVASIALGVISTVIGMVVPD